MHEPFKDQNYSNLPKFAWTWLSSNPTTFQSISFYFLSTGHLFSSVPLHEKFAEDLHQSPCRTLLLVLPVFDLQCDNPVVILEQLEMMYIILNIRFYKTNLLAGMTWKTHGYCCLPTMLLPKQKIVPNSS